MNTMEVERLRRTLRNVACMLAESGATEEEICRLTDEGIRRAGNQCGAPEPQNGWRCVKAKGHLDAHRTRRGRLFANTWVVTP